MYITECYKYEKDGIVCVGTPLPEGAKENYFEIKHVEDNNV